MRTKLRFITPLLASSAAATALLAAPVATAAPTGPSKICLAVGAEPTCQSPAGVEIRTNGPRAGLHPHGYLPHLVGRS
jgi:hypothetical protein